MTVLIEHYFDHHSAVNMDTYARDYLAAHSVVAECTPSARDPKLDLSTYSMLISRGALPDQMRARTRCFGGRNLSRIESLEYVRRSELDQMVWSTAKSIDEVEALFESWQTDTVILKRSDSWKGLGVSLIGRRDLEGLNWDPERDVFCSEVNREDGTVAKLECLAGHQVFTWRRRTPPVRDITIDGAVDREKYLTGDRIPEAALPEDLVARGMYCSALAARDGLGHISLDLMRSPDGIWRVIEMNTQEVAVWWTSQFETARRNYAAALHSLASTTDI